MVALVVLIGLLISALASWTALQIDRSSERRLLHLQTRQAALVITVAISGITSPLQAAVDTAAATGGDPSRFARVMAGQVGPNKLFGAAVLLRISGTTATPVARAESLELELVTDGQASATAPGIACDAILLTS